MSERERFLLLMAGYLEGDLAAEDREQLRLLLEKDEKLGQEFLKEVEMHEELRIVGRQPVEEGVSKPSEFTHKVLAAKRTARTSGRSSTGSSTRSSARGDAQVSGRKSMSRRGSAGGTGGKELMICLGVVGILVVVVLALYIQRNSEKATASRNERERNAAKEANIERGIEEYRKAEQVGLNYILGKVNDPPDLKALNSDKVYNVILTRRFKDLKKRKDDFVQVTSNTNQIHEVGKGASLPGKDEIQLSMGVIEGKEVVFAEKRFSITDKDDKVNQGGEITVIVYAVPAGGAP